MKEKKQLSKLHIKVKFGSIDKINKKDTNSIDKKLFLWRIIINSIFSLILVATFCLLWTSYSPAWKIFFFLTIWSFWSNAFYIITITIIDILLYREYKKCEKFNFFIRNDLIRIIFPFSISTVFIYWELVLLGDKFQGIGHSILDICKSFFLHGLVLIFMCFDLFTTKHINKKNNCLRDIFIISIIMAIHYILVVISKEVLDINPYDFLIIADLRQIIASFIILYIIVLNGYIVFYLIADNLFENEIINDKDNMSSQNESGDKLKNNEEKDENLFSDSHKKLNVDNNVNSENPKEESNNGNEVKNNESIKEEKKEENDNYEISEKENNTKVDVFEKRMEDYAANFIKVNTLNQMNNIKQDKNLIYIKKSKFGITDIKIPKNPNPIEKNPK